MPGRKSHARRLSFEPLESRQMLATMPVITSMPTISVSHLQVLEDSGTARFVLTLSSPSSKSVSVVYRTQAGTANSNDFVARQGTTVFSPGTTTRYVDVRLQRDKIVEDNEQFRLALSGPKNAILAKASAVATIVDDDTATVNLGQRNISARARQSLEIVVQLSRAVEVPVSVQLNTVDGSATAGVHYVPLVNQKVEFLPGERTKRIKVQLLDGTDSRIDFGVVSSQTSSLHVGLGNNRTTVTIMRDQTTNVKAVGDSQRIVPVQYAGLLANPDVGYQTFYASADIDPNVVSRRIPSTVYYTRVEWNRLEKTLGVYDWTELDREYYAAKAAGQKFAFRIMPFEEGDSGPLAYRQAGLPGYTFDAAGIETWVPDYNSPLVQTHIAAFLAALGRRYGNDPMISSVDIGLVGRWGEMHYFECDPAPPMPSTATWKWLFDTYHAHFSCPLLVNSDLAESNAEALRYAVGLGFGWRDDGWSDPWEMNVLLPQVLANAADSWKTAPVLLETMGTMKTTAAWREAIRWAAEHHVSAFNNKGEAIPAGLLPSVKDLLTKIGYRFTITSAQHATRVIAGKSLSLAVDWANNGNAPLYSNRQVVIKIGDRVIETGRTMEGFLPGARHDVLELSTTGITPGVYGVQIGLAPSGSTTPDIQLAIQGGRDNWYPLGTVTIV